MKIAVRRSVAFLAPVFVILALSGTVSAQSAHTIKGTQQAAGSSLPAAQQPAIAAVRNPQGQVQKQAQGSALWQDVTAETTLANGDTVRTQNGTATVVYSDQATIKLAVNTTITVKEESDTQDIMLKLGNLSVNVDHAKATKPFQFVTPTAVSAVRGTEVDFGFNADGLLTVDLHDGNVMVFNQDEDLELELTGGKKVAIYFDYATGSLSMKNDCDSSGDVEFLFRGKTYSTKPCDEIVTEPVTAAGEGEFPNPPGDDDDETAPDEGGDDEIPNPLSPTLPLDSDSDGDNDLID